MNKKSLPLSAILLGTLLTPQETKPAALPFVLSAIIVFPVGLFIFSKSIYTSYHPAYASDITSSMGEVELYTLDIHIVETKGDKKDILKTTLSNTNPYQLIEKTLELAKIAYRDRSKRITIKSSIKLYNQKTYTLKTFSKRNCSARCLRQALFDKIIIPEKLLTGNQEKALSAGVILLIPFYALYLFINIR